MPRLPIKLHQTRYDYKPYLLIYRTTYYIYPLFAEPYVVAWKRGIAILTAGSVKVTPDPRVRLVSGFNLQIRDAVPQDAGDYICQIATMEPREITHTVEILGK